MGRTYKRRPGTRPYMDYTPEQMSAAVAAVKKGMKIRAAAEKYSVKREALRKKCKDVVMKNAGGQTVLNEKEENLLCDYVIQLAEWGFPVTSFELRLLVRGYLQRQGKTIDRFSDGCTPGVDWAMSFIARNKDKLSTRLVSNINPKRAQLCPALVNKYFDNLEDIRDIPPENILNFDETNLSDDPGRVKCIAKRGAKYFERIQTATKSSTSVMFAGSASGTILPPFVVYKAEHVYDLWVQGGPHGARYSCSKSGWFDSTSFEEWFFSIALPYFRKLHTESDKPFVVIGDNLSSHFSLKVLESCKTFNIAFKCLPANSTHLCQPLDVAFFGPLKRYWREILTAFKHKFSGRNISVTKSHFPALLKELMEKLAPVAKESLQAGFRKCGLSPLNRNEVLRCLPQENLCSPEEGMAESVLHYLKGMRYGTGTNTVSLAAGSGAGRKKRLNREPGKSVSIDDVAATGSAQVMDEEVPSTSQSKKKGRKRIASSSSSTTDTPEYADSSDEETEQMETQHSQDGDENEDFGLFNETPQTDD